jgi:hypothetical protein
MSMNCLKRFLTGYIWQVPITVTLAASKLLLYIS